jgi:hypothetical protein
MMIPKKMEMIGMGKPARNRFEEVLTRRAAASQEGTPRSTSILSLSNRGNEPLPSALESLHPFERRRGRELRARRTLDLQLADLLCSLGHTSTPAHQ